MIRNYFEATELRKEPAKRNNIPRVVVKYGLRLTKKILLDSSRANLLTVFS